MKKCKVCGKDLKGEKCIRIESDNQYFCHYKDSNCFQGWFCLYRLSKMLPKPTRGLTEELQEVKTPHGEMVISKNIGRIFKNEN